MSGLRHMRLFVFLVYFLCLCHQKKISAEPHYSNLETFKTLEVSLGTTDALKKKKIKNAHAFKLGDVMLIGLAVGDSNPASVMQLAIEHARSAPDLNYCTWYLNHPKSSEPFDQTSRIEAARLFNHRDIKRSPSLLQEQEAIVEIWDAIEKVFFEESPSFLECVLDQHYLAIGCNGMVHRGPTVFGMLLAFTGCSVQHSLEIIDYFWPSEGLKNEVRRALLQKAYAFGQQHQEQSDRFTSALTAE